MQGNRKLAQLKRQAGRWTSEEHERFMLAITTYGKDWKKVQEIVGTRSGSQVRSHAQKFFNKLLKQQAFKKANPDSTRKVEESEDHDHQQSQNSFVKLLHCEDGSNITPIQILSLIQKESQNNADKKINIKNLQKKLEQSMAVIEEESNEDQQLDLLKRKTSFKSMNNILEAYQELKDPNKQNELENQSFLISLTKRYKRYFSKGGKFENLIDFGDPLQKIQQTIRKQSFTLPQGIEGSQEQLNQRKKRVILKAATAQLKQSQKQSFSQAMIEMKKKSKINQSGKQQSQD